MLSSGRSGIHVCDSGIDQGKSGHPSPEHADTASNDNQNKTAAASLARPKRLVRIRQRSVLPN